MEEIKDRREQLEEDNEKLRNLYGRIFRDFENYRKMRIRDQINLKIKEKIKFFKNILPLVDNFERARHQFKPESEEGKKLNSFYQGIHKQLLGILKEQGITSMLVVGKQFDPNLYEDVLREPSEEFNTDIVTEELKRGYQLEGKVLRRALVKVSTGKENGSANKVYNLSKVEKSQKEKFDIDVGDLISEKFIEKKTNRRTVLYIENDDDMRDLVSDNLEEYGFFVLKAKDAIKGKVLAIKYSPDLILFDLMLPGVDGLTLCQRLRRDERTSNIPILMMTALGGIKDKIKGFNAGADDYITKPFDLEELYRRINDLLKIE